jgi:hypothetical protein
LQCLIEVIGSSGEEMWRVDAYEIPYYSQAMGAIVIRTRYDEGTELAEVATSALGS